MFYSFISAGIIMPIIYDMSFRRTVESSHIPVIMLTSALSPSQVDHAKLVGAYACPPKPYDKNLIIKTIKSALKESGIETGLH